ncbi:MAG: hypothetical protein KGN79_12860 [Acidobacteriota bacterium]|nr:hypothetical protein [Acidobacteriota bacterium]
MCAALALTACNREKQAVEGVAKSASNAEHAAQAKATLLDQQRDALKAIPLPTKSMYVDVHDASAWANPFITVEADALDLRIILADANTSTIGRDPMLRPAAARRQEMQIRPSDLAEAVVAIPASAWRYGRVVAVAESPEADPKNRPAIRRSMEKVIQQLNDLGIVVEEWPGR